jgi:DNA-binding CsgD family transcriptional regulator
VRALAEVEEQTSPEGAALMLDLAMDAYFGADYDRMHEWGTRALEVAEQLDDLLLTAAAHAVVCLGDAYGDHIASAEAHHAEAQRLVDGLDDDAVALRLDAISNLGGAEIYLGRIEDAVRHATRGLAVGRATGQGQLYPLLTQELAVALGILGRLDEAKEHLDGVVEAARLVGNVQAISWSLVNSAWTTMFAGDLDEARRLAEESAELLRGLDDSPISTWSASVLGVVFVESGEPARGIEVIHSGAGGPELTRIPGFFRVTVQARVTEALLALGRLDEAERAASHSAELAAETGLAMPRVQAAHARASVLLAAGDARTAASSALDGAATADGIGARIDAGRCRTLAGRALHAAGDTEGAAEALAAAADVLDDCGAIRYRDEAERELRRLGRRDHRRRGAARADGDGLAALTARELEVARLVVDRKTNPEIAAELFLSQKTVETHLRNAFRKLDVSSRVELARAVERADRPA